MKEFKDKDLGFIKTADENFLEILNKYWKIILFFLTLFTSIFTFIFIRIYLNKQQKIKITSEIIKIHNAKKNKNVSYEKINELIESTLENTNDESQIALLLMMKNIKDVKELLSYIDKKISYKSQYMNNTDYIDNMNYSIEIFFLKVIFLLGKKKEFDLMKKFYMERKLQSSPFGLIIYLIMITAEKNIQMLDVLYKNFHHYPHIFNRKFLSGVEVFSYNSKKINNVVKNKGKK
ncbi:hypothetical protein AB836_01960 [Rickettsiales bacterium (ex Bugula neritina AB1)]|nr:hypothetical protein AB836_01960 [Rickettsiales bacterium (ex Bugula neritina AB1)]